jgi:transcriptional regulator with XRE-family HTH domain
MMKPLDSVTDKFRVLRERAGLSMDELAKGMGYKGASSIQRYENPDEYKKEFISPDIASKMLAVVVGKGAPAIEPREVWALTRPIKEMVSSFDPDDFDDTSEHGGGFTREHWKPSVADALPELDVRLGAGEGTVGEVINLPVGNGNISGHRVLAEWLIPREYLRSEAKASPSHTIVMEVIGDSMFPNYMPGDRVIVDLSQNRFVSDTVYSISDGASEPQIKRLQRVPFSDPVQVKIISDNPALETFTVDLERLIIIGRICGHIARR